jgi:hypothetical protein
VSAPADARPLPRWRDARGSAQITHMSSAWRRPTTSQRGSCLRHASAKGASGACARGTRQTRAQALALPAAARAALHQRTAKLAAPQLRGGRRAWSAGVEKKQEE